MKLVRDDTYLIFYWIDNKGNIVSPRFDYEEDADEWYISNSNTVEDINEQRGIQN